MYRSICIFVIKIKKGVCYDRKHLFLSIFHDTEITSLLKSSSLFTPSIPRGVCEGLFSRKRPFRRVGSDLEQGEIRSREEDAPAYSETLETIKKWLDLQVKDVECFVPPSVFSGRDQVKKVCATVHMALPPAQPLVELWRFKEFSALGSNEVDDNDPHHPLLSKGQFLTFPKPQMKFYQVSPQSFSLTAPRIQDAFKNIATSPYQAPTSVSTPLKQYLAWETVSRENIQILNHVFWFKSAMEKATIEMTSEIDRMKDSVDQEDIQQSMNYLQNCLHL